jgi:hypothetical protein
MKLLLAFVLISAAALNAGTIVISQGATPGTFSQPMNGPAGYTGFVDVGWTTGSSGYSNVAIDATLLGADSGGDLVDAYLTTSVGTSSQSPAFATATGIAVSGSYSSVDLFSGLTLAANTSYYLTIVPEVADRVYWGIDNSQPAPTLDTGVGIIPATFCSLDISGCATFPPATASFDPQSPAYFPLGANPIFSVTQEDSTVPEPGSMALFSTGLIGLGLLIRRRAS